MTCVVRSSPNSETVRLARASVVTTALLTSKARLYVLAVEL